MKRSKFLPAVLALAAFSQPSPIGADSSKLRHELEKIIRTSGARIGVYLKNLQTGEELGILADQVFNTQSVIKVPIMVEAFHQVQEGKLSLSERVEWKDSHRRLGAGVLRNLDAGLQPTVKDLITLMIIVSDNGATDVLLEKLGRENVNRRMKEMGFRTIRCLRTLLDTHREQSAAVNPEYASLGPEDLFRRGLPQGPQYEEANWRVLSEDRIRLGESSLREMGLLLEKIYRGLAVSPEASQSMLAILRLQQRNNRIPRYLEGVPVAHKTGDKPPYFALDAGIIEQPVPLVLVLAADRHRGYYVQLEETLGRIAKAVYDFYALAAK